MLPAAALSPAAGLRAVGRMGEAGWVLEAQDC